MHVNKGGPFGSNASLATLNEVIAGGKMGR